jgi:hypothetical protein
MAIYIVSMASVSIRPLIDSGRLLRNLSGKKVDRHSLYIFIHACKHFNVPEANILKFSTPEPLPGIIIAGTEVQRSLANALIWLVTIQL